MNAPSLSFEDIMDRKTLILGDINTGKTTLTRDMFAEFCRRGLGERIAILDLAPEIPLDTATRKGLPGAGGKLLPPEECNALYLSGHFTAPRLTSKTEEEALEKARRNRRIMGRLFQRLKNSSRDILVANDISMALQAGTTASLIRVLATAGTVVANGYWGERLGGGKLTAREKARMIKLKAWFEREGRVIILKSSDWFLSEEIQGKIRESEEEFRKGNYKAYEDPDDLIKDLPK